QMHEALGDVDVRNEAKLYNATADALRREIEVLEDETGCLLVLAHNPGVHILAAEYLSESAASPAILDRLAAGFPTGAAALFSVDVAGRCTYEGFLTPRTLGAA
ncbi:hypothetical protein LTR94_027333, partial [Friedmanniomyces endolithicus]